MRSGFRANLTEAEIGNIATRMIHELFRLIKTDLEEGPSTSHNRTAAFQSLAEIYHSSLSESLGADYIFQKRKQLEPSVDIIIWSHFRSMATILQQIRRT